MNTSSMRQEQYGLSLDVLACTATGRLLHILQGHILIKPSMPKVMWKSHCLWMVISCQHAVGGLS